MLRSRQRNKTVTFTLLRYRPCRCYDNITLVRHDFVRRSPNNTVKSIRCINIGNSSVTVLGWAANCVYRNITVLGGYVDAIVRQV